MANPFLEAVGKKSNKTDTQKNPFLEAVKISISKPEYKIPVENILSKSTSPYKLSGPTQLSKLEKPSAFADIKDVAGEITSRMGNTIKTAGQNIWTNTKNLILHPIKTIKEARNVFQTDIEDTVNNYYSTLSKTAEDIRDDSKGFSDKAASIFDATKSTIDLIFSPISILAKDVAGKIPGINVVSESLFGAMNLGADILGPIFKKTVEVMPVSPELKNQWVSRADELGSFIGVMTIGGLLYSTGEKGLTRLTGNDIPNQFVKANTPEKVKNILDTGEFAKLAEADKLSITLPLAEAKTRGEVKDIFNNYAKNKALTLLEEVKTQTPKEEVKNPFLEVIKKEKIKKPTKIKEEIKPAEEFKSRVYDRLKEEYPDVLEGDVLVKRVNMEKDIQKAIDLVETNKQKAYDIAMGKETSSDILSTNVSIALQEKALQEGNTKLASKLITNRTLEQTRRGQEIVAEKGSVKNNSTSRYVKELISSRLDKLGKDYLGDLTDVFKKKSTKERAMSKIDNEVVKLEKSIKNKKLELKDALSLLDKLTCV
jgi:hypothetical protein